MIQLRPTFSESWYRVKDLKVRLRAAAQISRQFYRGERWYVVRDPAGNQYHRLSDAAYRFVALLDGERTVAEAWDTAGGQLADDAPTQPEVIQILSQLYAANLVEADITPDAGVLLRRHKQMVKRQWQQRVMNLLFPRIPIWDPDKFLKRWMPVMEPILSKWGGLVWIGVVIAALATVLPLMPELKQAAQDSISPGNWFYLWAMFVLIKFVHELGHAFGTRRFGGECHEMGIMFLVFIPTPYVDASAAWAFPNRWHRMFVGAAGMIFELFFASLLAFVWAYTNSSTTLLGVPVNQLAFNGMLVASVTTVLFNANPLLRYDGYYMLSDFLEIPNLQFRSTEYVLGLVKRHVFRVKARNPLPPVGQRLWLFFYGIASSIYRVFVGIMIILVVTWEVPVLGVLMALAGVATWLVMPVVKVFRYLALDPELHRKRTRATAFTVAVAAAVVLVVGVIPFWVRYSGEGITEARQRLVLHAEVPGFVQQVNFKNGDRVKAGDVILVAKDDRLEAEVAQLKADLASWRARHIASRVKDVAQQEATAETVEAYKANLADAERRLAQLTIRAPFDGEVVAPHLHELKGKYLQRGEEVAMVIEPGDLVVRMVLPQADAALARMSNEKEAQVRLAGRLGEVFRTADMQLIESAQPKLPHASLGHAGGGEVATSPRDPEQPAQQQFEMRVTLKDVRDPGNGELQFYPGQKAYVRLTLSEKRPLMWQWWRRLMQLIETKSKNAKWV